MVDDFTSFSLPLIRNTGTRRPWWRRVLDWILRRKFAKPLSIDDLVLLIRPLSDPIVRIESYYSDDICGGVRSDPIVRIEDEKDDIVDYSESS